MGGEWTKRHTTRPAIAMLVALLAVTLVALGTGGSAAPAPAAALLRAPYASEMVGTTATVNWATDRSQSTGSAVWGPVVAGQCTPTNSVAATRFSITVGATAEYQWSATLPFATPGTYCYRVRLGPTDLLGTDPSPRLTTAAAAGTAFSFAVLGDWGGGTTAEADVFRRIGASPADFVVTTGDNVYTTGTETEYGDLTQGNVFPARYLPAMGSRPIFATEGNHGFSTNLPYLQNFRAPVAAASSGGRFRAESYCCISTLSGAKTYPSSWYAFDWGAARFYVLEGAFADSQGAYQGDFLAHWNGPVAGCGPCGAELDWLRTDLAAHPGALKFAFLHYPLYSDSSNQTSDTYLSGPDHLEGLLAGNNVGVLFSGHAHHYERNLPQIPGKPLVTYVTGGGGAALGTVGTCSAFDAYAIGSSSSCHAPKPASAAKGYHFLLVTVNGNQVTVTPTDSTGATFDVQTYSFPTPATGPDTTPPAAPGNLQATATGPTGVSLTWQASTDDVGVTGYTITRNGTPLTSVGGAVTTLADGSATPATAYTYTVVATDAAGNPSAPSNVATVTTPAGVTSYTFTPTDDASIDQTQPAVNFGTDARLVTDGSPLNDFLLRFQVATGGCTVTHADLLLTVGTTGSDASAKGGSVHTTGGGWSEGTVTWATAPAAATATLGAPLGAVAVNTTYSVDVTAGVTGDGAVNLRVNSTSSDGARYFSREGSGSQLPRLVVTCA
jgi:hypothetical protein